MTIQNVNWKLVSSEGVRASLITGLYIVAIFLFVLHAVYHVDGLNVAAMVLVLLSAFYSVKLPDILLFIPPIFAVFTMTFTFAKFDNLLIEDFSLFMFLSMLVTMAIVGVAFTLWFDKTTTAIGHRISRRFDDKSAQKLLDRLTAYGNHFYSDYNLEYLAGDQAWAVKSKAYDGTVNHFKSKTRAVQWAVIEYFKKDHPEEYLLQKKWNRRLSAVYVVGALLFSILLWGGGLLFVASVLRP